MLGARADFAVQGPWHCPQCACRPIATYTTWISLSHATLHESVLAVAPGTHRELSFWDIPAADTELPGDFNTKTAEWVIPQEVSPGDIIMFNLKTIHAASLNKSCPRRYRVRYDCLSIHVETWVRGSSCDTRVQLQPKE